MSFDWKFFNRLASDFISDQRVPGIPEAYYRTAINRSYYSVFCSARDILRKDGVTLPHEHVHQFVREKYLKATEVVKQQIGENLKRLYWDRIKADYETNASLGEKQARTAQQLAVNTLQKIEKL